MSRERRFFSEEFKREAVKLASQPGANKSAIARDFLLTFTLPAQFRPLCQAHQSVLYELLMRAAWAQRLMSYSYRLIFSAQPERFIPSTEIM